MIDDSLLITKTQVSDKLMEIFLKCVPIVSCPSIFENSRVGVSVLCHVGAT